MLENADKIDLSQGMNPERLSHLKNMIIAVVDISKEFSLPQTNPDEVQTENQVAIANEFAKWALEVWNDSREKTALLN